MSKQFENSFSWNVKRYEFNRKTIEDFDVIPFISVIIRKLKRQSVNKRSSQRNYLVGTSKNSRRYRIKSQSMI